MKVLSVDYGTKRVGLAVGDTELKIAVPKGTLKNDKNLIDKLVKTVREGKIGILVVGLPLTPSGREGQRAMEVKEFAKKLKDNLPEVKLVLWDERYTTQEAIRRVRGRRSKEDIDALSAQIILEEFLESL